MQAILQGAVVGFSIAAPVGPIGLLVLRRSLEDGRRSGFLCGLGAATADLCYGALAAAGVTFLAAWQRPAGLAGGLLLLFLAWQSWRSRPGNEAARAAGFFSTFLLTLSNPMTILSFAALVTSTGTTTPLWFVGGVFLGSLAWWALLSGGASLLRSKLQGQALIWLNRLAAAVLAAFGAMALWRAF